MQKLKLARAVSISLALAFTGYAIGQTISKDQYPSEKDKIASEYKFHKAHFASMSGNAIDVCKADADHEDEVTNENCFDLSGNNKDVCVKAAKDARVHAKSYAKTQMETDKTQVKFADANQKAAAKIADAKQDASKDKRNADCALAKEKCD